MSHIKTEIDPKLIKSTECGMFTPADNSVYPRIHKIEDGNAKFYLTPTYSFWITKEQFSTFLIEDDTEKFQSAPNLGISEATLLKAMAIAQDPKLAQALLAS